MIFINLKKGIVTMPTTKVMQLKNNQFIITIPKSIAQAMRIDKGVVIEWLFLDGNVVIKVRK